MPITVSMFGVKLTIPNSTHLITMQNKAVRLIARVTPRKDTDPLYSAFNIMPLKSLFMYAFGLFI